MGLYNWLITSLMEPNDDFSQRLRKNFAGYCLLPGFPGAFFSAIFIAMNFDGTVATFVKLFANIVLSVACAAIYISTRKLRHVGNAQILSFMWIYFVQAMLLSMVIPQYDGKATVVFTAFMGVFLEVPGIPFFLGVCFVGALMGDWNTAHISDPSKLIVLPGYTNNLTNMEMFLSAVSVSFVLGIVAVTFVFVIRESNRRGKAQKAANEMTLAILKHQRKYNTAKITEVIDQCKADGVVDAELLELYTTMNSNLESYRPFLPNYLFNDDSSSGGDDDVEQVDQDDDEESGDMEEGPLSARTDDSPVFGRAGDDHSSSRRMASRASSTSSTKVNTRILNSQRGALFNGPITFAFVDINSERLPQSDFRGNITEILKFAVRSVYAVARETKASVHSMLGDTVQLTWNATQPVALSETKGATFLARLAKRFELGADMKKRKSRLAASVLNSALPDSLRIAESHTHGPNVIPVETASLILSAAICTGKACVHSITSDNQQALVIEAPWLPVLEGCFDLAKRVGEHSSAHCVLADERTAKGCHLEVEACAVEMAWSSEGYQRTTFVGKYPEELCVGETQSTEPPGTSTVIYQVLGEYQRADDEWMYQLDQGQDGKDASLLQPALRLKAVTLAAEGQFSAGLEALTAAVIANSKNDRGSAGTTDGPSSINPAFTKALQVKCTSSTL